MTRFPALFIIMLSKQALIEAKRPCIIQVFAYKTPHREMVANSDVIQSASAMMTDQRVEVRDPRTVTWPLGIASTSSKMFHAEALQIRN